MKCQRCNSKEAIIRLTQVINGQKIEKQLCEECAKELQININIPNLPSMPFPLIFGGLLGFNPTHNVVGSKEVVCSNCGISFAEFNRTGRLGCPECYENLKPQIEFLVKRIHGNSVHSGKIPLRTGKSIILSKKLKALRKELENAIASEEYEKAAELRDQLKNIQAEIEIDVIRVGEENNEQLGK